jgi:2-C-methyl-D-erythritol 4-phosphate cytidylyltransferase/2-C-methyl-D-erythritol 2,4-cyclodiphosphate synthase
MSNQTSLHTIALIVAAGNSERLGGAVAKPYITLGDKTVLRHSIDTFLSHSKIDGVRVVINRKHHMLYKKTTRDITLFPPVFGASRRQDSVRLGLESLTHRSPTYVLIHDAARPLIDHATIDRVISGLEKAHAVLPFIPVQDTIRSRSTLLDRSTLQAAQTPQGFHFEAILHAHRQLRKEDFTDDIALAEALGVKVELVHGDTRNMKLTTPEQLNMLEHMMNTSKQEARLANRASHERAERHPMDTPDGVTGGNQNVETRVGMGLDVHAFTTHTTGTPASEQVIIIGGLAIPFNKKLDGHSDADVALHALVDALLGAIGEGDIGQHFPPTDAKWKGASSKQFVLHAAELVRKKGGEVVNIDLTIIGEQPKISPHREAMRQQIASLLKLDVRRINVKATTTEKLGFLGRSEGLAAQALATVKLPV